MAFEEPNLINPNSDILPMEEKSGEKPTLPTGLTYDPFQA